MYYYTIAIYRPEDWGMESQMNSNCCSQDWNVGLLPALLLLTGAVLLIMEPEPHPLNLMFPHL